MANSQTTTAAATVAEPTATEPTVTDTIDLDGIAIVGMDGRFPGANSIEAFWQNLAGGVESIITLSDEALIAAGVPVTTLSDPNYVKAGSVLSDVDRFDAAFFGISPREAKAMDPQHRCLLECAWGALENAGYNSETYDGRIGVYTGTSLSTYLHHNLLANEDFLKLAGNLQIEIGNDKDFVPTRISYKMNLKGPSVAINTACSSSLVSVHIACQGLLDQECDMALAGGATIQVPHGQGYWYQPDGIESPDGHCRPFDANAQGTIFGSGVGMVVLKRLEDAIADRDSIYAVIRGSAINNDGALKVGYTAPSVDGQAEAIAEAQAIADVDPETITYIETHGTGTGMGDPIEMSALSQVFQGETEKTGFCAVGSVKGNIGHLNRAAGVIGLIKTALALKHKQLPPSLNFEKANPLIDFERSPFYVNTTLQPWQRNGTPRRAGVSSFGIGGTNAHAVLEEAPVSSLEASSEQLATRPYQLLVVSAKTKTALETATQNLAQHLKERPELTAATLADTAFTLQVGRQAFSHRRIVVAQDGEGAIAALETPQPPHAFTQHLPTNSRPSVVFMFSGQGSQHVNMARGLYEHEPIFRNEVDQCAQILQPVLNLDLRQLIYPNAGQTEAAAEKLQQTAMTQPALFVIEYALTKLWMAWGIEPAAMIGHSIGEYVAACLAGVFSLEDALRLVAARGEMMQQLPSGAMLAVFLPPHKIIPLLTSDLSLATSNSPKVSSVSGSHAAIDELAQRLQSQGIEYRPLKTSHAFHSHMMEPILEKFTHRVAQLTLHPPQRPYVSNVTGTWITESEATDPSYWAKHLRQTVHFSEGLALLLQDPERILLEVGPGKSLRSLAKQQPKQQSSEHERTILASMRHPKDETEDGAVLLRTLGQLWLTGVSIDWDKLYAPQSRQRLPLPTYPFERRRFWVDPQPRKPSTDLAQQLNQLLDQSEVSEQERSLLHKLLGKLDGPPSSDTNSHESEDWLYQFKWQPQQSQVNSAIATTGSWLILADQGGVGEAVANRLTQLNQRCTLAYLGDSYTAQSDNSWQLNPKEINHFERFFQDALDTNAPPLRGVLHFWSLEATPTAELTLETLEQSQTFSTESALRLIQTLNQYQHKSEAHTVSNGYSADSPKVWLVTQNAVQAGDEQSALAIAQSPIWGLGKVIALEHSALWGGLVDLGENAFSEVAALATEVLATAGENQLAFRGTQRYVARLVRAPQSAPQSNAQTLSTELHTLCADEETYLITGGLGSLGLQVADWLAEQGAKHLMLVGRRPASVSARRAIARLQHVGITVQIGQADVADFDAIAQVFQTIKTTMPPLRGIIHTAGVTGYNNIKETSWSAFDTVCRPKVQGTWNLHQLSKSSELDFFVCFSSIASVWGAKGQAAYAAANQFLDGFAQLKQQLGYRTLSVNWGPWANSEMAAADVKEHLGRMGIQTLASAPAIDTMATLLKASTTCAQVIVADINWPIFKSFYEVSGQQTFLEQIDLAPANHAHLNESIKESIKESFLEPAIQQPILQRLQLASPGSYTDILTSHLREQISHTLSMSPAQLNPDQAINYLGLDSLMAIELKNLIKTQLGVEIPTAKFMAGLSVNSLTNLVKESLQAGQSDAPGRAETVAVSPNSQPIARQQIKQPMPPKIPERLPQTEDAKVDTAAPIHCLPKEGIPLPLSHGQRALWFLAQRDRTSSAYNVSIPARIQASVNVPALKQAFQGLSDRHATLRTTFSVNADGVEPCQIIHKTLPICFKQIDSAGWDEVDLKKAVTAAHRESFDLEQGPIFRVTLFTCGEQDHVLLLSLHHIVYDAWSIGPLLNDAAQLYTAAQAATITALPPLTQQYDNYVQWQNQTLAGPEGDRLLAYWQNQLAGDLPTLDLPTDRPHLQQTHHQGASHTFAVKPDQIKALKTLAQTEGVTLYTLLMAAFQSLLYRYTGQTDVLVGSPMGGRPQKAFEQIVGYFVNPVTIRGALSDRLTFQDFLGQIHTTILDAIDHQAFPFPLLVEKLEIKRDLVRSPIFQVLFNFLKLPQIDPIASILVPRDSSTSMKRTVQWADLELESFDLAQQESQFDLTLEMFETEDALLGVFQYSSELFNADTIERMAGHFQTLLAAIVANPTQPIAHLPLLTSAEHNQFARWNGQSRKDPLQLSCIHQCVEAQAVNTPTKTAVICGTRHLTYQALNERANQVARHLQAEGVRPDDLVGLCVERSLEMVVGILGILKAGGAYVPLDPSYPQSRLDYMLQDSGTQVVVTQKSLCSLLHSTALSTVCLDTDWPAIAQQDTQNLETDVSPSNLAYVIYTSGSTGKPKGVMIQHDSLVNFTQAAVGEYGFGECDRVLQFASISFDAAAEEIYPCLTQGGTLVLRNDEMLGSVAQFLQTCQDWQLTILDLPTAYWQKIVLELAAGHVSLPETLQLIIIGGERVSPDQVRAWQTHIGDRPRLMNTYGPTEATVVATAYTITRAAAIPGEVPIGKALANVQTYVLDEQLQQVPIGVPGELHIGGMGLAQGYLNRPALTEERFIANPLSAHLSSHPECDRLYKTGDLVRYLPDGTLEYLGRIDHQVKIRGFRIELGEIEAALNQHTAVKQAVVIAREDDPEGKRLVAYLIMTGSEKVTTSEFRQLLQKTLPDYMVPAAFVILEALPITPNGKVDRRALPKPQAADLASVAAYVAPRNAVEQQLTNIWESLLKVKPISIYDSFFDLGGHSLLTIGLFVQIEKCFGKKLPLSTVMTAPTIAQLAVILEPSLASQQAPQQRDSFEVEAAPAQLDSIVLLRAGESFSQSQGQNTVAPLFLFHDADGETLLYRTLAHALDAAIPVYGVQPYRTSECPILHTRMTDMVRFYVEQIRQVQPQGPYFLGGLCIGGILAFEVAYQLQQQGESVGMVALLDAPELNAPERTGLIVEQRMKRFAAVLSGNGQHELPKRLANIVSQAGKKALNVVAYESQKKIETVRDRTQLTLLRRHLDSDRPLPSFLKGISTRTVLDWAECRQDLPQETFEGEVTLFRATQASDIFEGTDIDDTPMRELYSDPLLGWESRVTQGVRVYDVPGGHSSMLQTPNVQVIADKIQTIYRSLSTII